MALEEAIVTVQLSMVFSDVADWTGILNLRYEEGTIPTWEQLPPTALVIDDDPCIGTLCARA
jgi:hypothetical protein